MCFVGFQNHKANFDAAVTVSTSTAMCARRNGSMPHFAVMCPSGSLLAFCSIALVWCYGCTTDNGKQAGLNMRRD